ncbi:MAG: diguanylate cyclase [Nevskiaceae bacterium]|nr:MAG: diguanylate cyclase [Nevskiaceae bacterium]
MRHQPPEFAQAVLDSLTAHIAVLDAQGCIIGVNEPWRRFAADNCGESARAYVGENYLAICERAFETSGDPTIAAVSEGLRRVLDSRADRIVIEYPCHSPEAERWFTLRITRCDVGGASRAVVAHEDITARKKAELAQARAEQTLRTILETLPVGVWVIDAQGRVIHGNAAGQRIWAGDRALQPAGNDANPGDWAGNGQGTAPSQWCVESVIADGEPLIDQEIQIVCGDGSRKFLLNSAVPLREPGGTATGVIVVNQDITARHQAQIALQVAQAESERMNQALQQSLQRERAAAQTDELTGIFNRRHFLAVGRRQAELARRHDQPLSVVMFDVDHFKSINDRYGHDVGDEALRHVARVVGNDLRSSDVFARYGGEEFIVLLPETDAQSAWTLAERLRQRIAQTSLPGQQEPLCVTVSAGVAENVAPATSLEQVIKRADQALYAAKNDGRNRSVMH